MISVPVQNVLSLFLMASESENKAYGVIDTRNMKTIKII